MGWVCAICSHSRRLEVDRAILGGMSKSRIAEAFGVPEYSVRNHAEKHLTRQLLKANEMRELAESRSLSEEIQSLITRTKAILDKAESEELHMVSLKAISELRQTFGFMVSTAFLLKQDEREEALAQKRNAVDDLKARFDREELEMILDICNKRPDQRLVAFRLMDRTQQPVPPEEPPPSTPGKRRPLAP